MKSGDLTALNAYMFVFRGQHCELNLTVQGPPVKKSMNTLLWNLLKSNKTLNGTLTNGVASGLAKQGTPHQWPRGGCFIMNDATISPRYYTNTKTCICLHL